MELSTKFTTENVTPKHIYSDANLILIISIPKTNFTSLKLNVLHDFAYLLNQADDGI